MKRLLVGCAIAAALIPTTAHARVHRDVRAKFRHYLIVHRHVPRHEVNAACWIVENKHNGENKGWRLDLWGGHNREHYGLGQLKAGGYKKQGGMWKGWWWRNRKDVDKQAARMLKYARGRYSRRHPFTTAKRTKVRTDSW